MNSCLHGFRVLSAKFLLTALQIVPSGHNLNGCCIGYGSLYATSMLTPPHNVRNRALIYRAVQRAD